MVEVVLDLDKTLEQNAGLYYDRVKKSKVRLAGAQRAIERSKSKLAELLTAQSTEREELEQEHERKAAKKPAQWFEKFRWFVSSEGFLCVGGRDGTTNEVLIKKHTAPDDIVFHTKIEGSPFFVVKCEGKIPGEITIAEAAQATASYSRAWRLGMVTLEVFWVRPEQVSKKAPSGEYLVKGSFTISGKMNLSSPAVQVAIGLTSEGSIVGGPVGAVKSHAVKVIMLRQGRGKPGEIIKKIQKKLGGGAADEIMKFLPSGGIELS